MVIRSLARTEGLPADVLVSYAAQVAADVTEPAPVTVGDHELQIRAARDALRVVLRVAGVMGASGVRQLEPGDFRTIVDQAAREIGVEL